MEQNMRIKIFDNLDELNDYLDKHRVKDIQWNSSVVDKRKEKDEIIYEIVDRWMIKE